MFPERRHHERKKQSVFSNSNPFPVSDFYADTCSALQKLRQQAKSSKEYDRLTAAYFERTENAMWDSAAHQVRYIKAFSKTQSLLVELAIREFSDTSAAPAEILTWNTIVTTDWEPDTSQSVYKGE